MDALSLYEASHRRWKSKIRKPFERISSIPFVMSRKIPNKTIALLLAKCQWNVVCFIYPTEITVFRMFVNQSHELVVKCNILKFSVEQFEVWLACSRFPGEQQEMLKVWIKYYFRNLSVQHVRHRSSVTISKWIITG